MEEYLFRVYLTDSTKVISSSISGAFGGELVKNRWVDLIKPQEINEDVDADEIINNIREKLET